MHKCPSCGHFASLSAGNCWKCGARLVNQAWRKNAHLRRTLPYDTQSDVVRDARHLLQGIRLVRMKQDSCPGSGHFAAGRSALEGVIQLGFTGTIEVIHAADQDSLANMPLCYDRFADGGLDVVGPLGNRVRINYVRMGNIHELPLMEAFAATEEFFAGRGRAVLGIFGASDGHGTEEDELPFNSPAESLNTRCAVVLQPFAWNQMRMVEDTDSGYREQILKHSLASYITEVPDLLARLPPYQRDERRALSAFQAYVNENPGSLDDACASTVAQTLAKTACGGCYLLPVYGLHANYPGTWTINGLTRAIQMLRKSGVLDGPVVIFNIRGGYDPEEETRGRCTYLRAGEGGASRTIAEAVDGIFVVRSPGLPTALFQQMAANATLPMLLEGANTANLCFQLGTPFLGVSDNASIPPLDEHGARGHTQLRALTRFLWGARRASDEEVVKLAEAIRDAVTPDTELSRYFRRLHEQVRAPEGDQLAFALALLDRQIRQHGPPLPEIEPVALEQVPLRAPVDVPVKPTSNVYVCPRCRKFASVGPGSCWKCGVALVAEPR